MATFEVIDYVEDEPKSSSKPDDFMGILVDNLSSINYKLIFFLYLIFLFITSDVFVDKVLNNISDASEYRCPTTKGTLIQGLFLVLFYMIVDVVIKLGCI